MEEEEMLTPSSHQKRPRCTHFSHAAQVATLLLAGATSVPSIFTELALYDTLLVLLQLLGNLLHVVIFFLLRV